MPSSCRRQGRTIQSEAREVVRCVIEACDFENTIGNLHYPLWEPTKRAAFYTRFSERTINRIRKEAHADGNKSPSSDEEKDSQTDDSKDATETQDTKDCKGSDVCVVQLMRHTIMDFYMVNKIVPSWSQLLTAMKKKKDLKWGVATYRRLLRDIGFKRKKFENKKKILLERPEISLWRLDYLKSIRKAREDKKNVVYVADTWVDNKLNVRNCWHSNDFSELQTSRFIILEAANANGFIENAQHITKVGQTTKPEDLLTYENFKKWLTDKLLPNIPDNSVVVLDGGESYHMVEQNKAPSKYSTKEEMTTWLEKNDVPFSTTMCKVELMDLVNTIKTDEKVYCVDEQLKVKGHTLLRLPPHMCELNPLHAAWEKMDSILRVKKETEASSLTLTSFKKLREIIVGALGSFTEDDWKGFCAQVQTLENDWWAMDSTLDAEMEEMIANAENSEMLPNATESGSEFSESSDEEEVVW